MSCDRELVTQRPEALGPLPSKQGLVSKLESFYANEMETPRKTKITAETSYRPGLNMEELKKLDNLKNVTLLIF